MNELLNGLSNWLGRFFRRNPQLWQAILLIGWLKKWLNRKLIERCAGRGFPRPRPFSLRQPFTSWPALTDQTYTGRQLAEDPVIRDRPDTADLMPLFRREGNEIPSQDTSVLFAYFAQWFTDSFIRTRPETSPEAWRRNSSNHEIDLCQIYGLTEEATTKLRSGKGGRLKSETGADGEEYPPRLFAQGVTHEKLVFSDPEFAELHSPERLAATIARVPDAGLPTLFATGLEQGNATPGNIVLNIVFLRAHNHVADRLASAYPDWKDEQIFQTTRNVMVALLLKIVLREYIAHIATLDFPFDLDPEVGERSGWKRANWIGIEFGILYRWHSLVPDFLRIGQSRIPMAETLSNPGLVTGLGLGALIDAASRQRAGRIGLHNTPAIFTQPRPIWLDGELVQLSVQQKTVEMTRRAKIRPYNAYRKAFGMAPVRSFEALTGEAQTASELAALYRSVEDLDWYVGLLAEAHEEGAMMGDLMCRMVAFDAFTHIFGNPLLAKGVFNETTFSKTGWDIIHSTDSFSQIVAWTVRNPERVAVSFKALDGTAQAESGTLSTAVAQAHPA